jgi:hypothetical protein
MYRIEKTVAQSPPFPSFDEAQRAHLVLAEENDRFESGWREDRAGRASRSDVRERPAVAGPPPQEGAPATETFWRTAIDRLRRAISEFEWRLAATGAQLANPDQRLLAQSLLDFWGLRQSELRLRTYELRSAAGKSVAALHSPRPKTLLDYDESGAPELADDANPFARILPQTSGDSVAGRGAQVLPEFAGTVAGADDLRTAIAHVANGAGLQISNDAISLVLRQVSLYPESLALARWAFDWLWQHRDRNRIPDQLIAELGDPAVRIAETAEATYAGLGDGQKQALARQLFLAMVCQVGDVLQRTSLAADRLASIGQPAAVTAVIGSFEKKGIITRVPPDGAGGERFVLAHDALLLHWQRLRDWSAERAKEERDLALVHAAALSWSDSGSVDDLPLGDTLERAEQYADRDPLVASYVEAGRQLRTVRRRRRFYVVSTAALVFLPAALVLFFHFRERPSDQAEQLEAASSNYAAAQQVKPAVDLTADMSSGAAAPAADAPGIAGWIWVGSTLEPQLVDLKGAPADPAAIRKGQKLALRTSIYLRKDAPGGNGGDAGARKPVVGVGNAGFFVVALDDPRPHGFQGTTQYWLPVRLVPRIFVQLPAAFADKNVEAGSERRGALLTDWFGAQGYDLPPVQWLKDEPVQHEIRYYHAQDKAPSEDLARRLNLLVGGDPAEPVTARLMDDPALVARVREGVIELWLGDGTVERAVAAIRDARENNPVQ